MEKIYCPINGWSCPYFKDNGVCTIDHPEKECDDYMIMEECLNNEDENNIYIFGS